MLRDQISGLPVVENGKLVGIITASDVLNAFLDMTGATTPNSVRITVVPREDSSLADAAKVIEAQGGEILGVGIHREPDHQKHEFFLRLRGLDVMTAATALRKSGYTVR